MARTKQTARGSKSQGSPARFSSQRASDSDLPTSPLARRPLSQPRAPDGGNVPADSQGPSLPADPDPTAEPGNPDLPVDPTPTAEGSKRVFGGKAAASKPVKKRRSTEVSPRAPLSPDRNRGTYVSTSKSSKGGKSSAASKKKPDRKTPSTASKAHAKKPTKAA